MPTNKRQYSKSGSSVNWELAKMAIIINDNRNWTDGNTDHAILMTTETGLMDTLITQYC